MRRLRYSEWGGLLTIGMALLTVTPAFSQMDPTKSKIAKTPNRVVQGEARAIEGDTLSINGTIVRLMGIDSPDRGQRCRNMRGRELDCFTVARRILESLLQGRNVECTIAERDRNRQFKGECRADGVDLGGAMVARGWAFAYRALTPAYASSEAYAQRKGLGLWSGKVEKPWEWRSRRQRETAR